MHFKRMHLLLGYYQRRLTVLNQTYGVRSVLLFSQMRSEASQGKYLSSAKPVHLLRLNNFC